MARRKTQGHLFFLCFLAALIEGYDLQAAGVTAPKFAPQFHFDPAALAWVFSANTFGLFLGAIIGGRLADTAGRRLVLITSLAVFGAFSLATAVSPDGAVFIALRFLTGLGLGGALPNFIAMTAEATTPENAARRVTLVSSAMPMGGAIAAALMVLAPAMDWRIVFWIGGLAPLFLAAAMLAALPESPAFQRDRVDTVAIRQALAGEGRTRTTLLLWLAFFLNVLVLHLMLNWLPSLLVGKGFAKPEAVAVALAFTLGGAAGGLALGALARREGRLLTYILTWLGMAAGMAWLGLVQYNLTLAIAAGASAGFCVTGGLFLLYGLAAELYPAHLRGTGVGFAVGVGRLGSVAGPLFAGVLLVSGRTPGTVMLALVPMILIALAAVTPLVRRR